MKKGFTLAEALIALSLLGVVAALTVPNILYKGNDKKLIAQARKVAATMQDAIDLKYSLYGEPQKNKNDEYPKFLEWIMTTGDDSQKSTLKTKYHSNNIVITSDGIVYADLGDDAKKCFTSTGCKVCADINGSAGPTTKYSITNLTNSYNKLVGATGNNDIVCFKIMNGQIQTGENNLTDTAYTRFNKYINEEI